MGLNYHSLNLFQLHQRHHGVCRLDSLNPLLPGMLYQHHADQCSRLTGWSCPTMYLQHRCGYRLARVAHLAPSWDKVASNNDK